MQPYYQRDNVTLYCGDNREVLPTLDAAVSAVVTDPPYGLSFMGKAWDHGVPGESFWRIIGDAMLPGAHLLSFGGTRTFHRIAVAIEDAGFEIRDTLQWIYGSGFPKSADISKHIDKMAHNRWLNVCKAIDNMSQDDIIGLWKDHSSRVRPAALTFQKSPIETGTSTPKSGSVPALVRLEVSLERSHASAIIAELSSSEARRTIGVTSPSAPSHAASSTTVLSVLVSSVERSPASPEAMPGTMDSSAPCDASDCHDASTAKLTRAEEALRIWLGSNKSSKQAATDALCAALIDDLKHTILSRSRTFQSLDTISQTDFVSATTATITESTAASLISSTVDTLRAKAIDKMAGAEREVVGVAADFARDGATRKTDGSHVKPTQQHPHGDRWSQPVTAPATPEAAQWAGWGTALKPAHEPIIMARKHLSGTVAANVLQYGTGALNIDASRIRTPDTIERGDFDQFTDSHDGYTRPNKSMYTHKPKERSGPANAQGRWPANVILDEAAAAQLDEMSGERKSPATYTRTARAEGNWLHAKEAGTEQAGYGDSGGASRFFYVAKASRAERRRGLPDDMQASHPTVKPLALMRYLITLVCPPGGTVLDPFAGSGTTGVACAELGFPCVLIEQDPEYCEIIARRVDHALNERARTPATIQTPLEMVAD